MIIAVLLGCGPPDRCDEMCIVALDRFSACLEEDGLDWGPEVGYADAVDYENACATWSWEARQLGTADTCDAKLTVFRDGDCDAYRAAWAP